MNSSSRMRMIGEMSTPPRFGKQVADRPQGGFGDPVEHFPDLSDEGVAHVHDVEGHQPNSGPRSR